MRHMRPSNIRRKPSQFLTPEKFKLYQTLRASPTVSKEARIALRRAVQRGATVFELVEPSVIYEQAGWRCQNPQCGKLTKKVESGGQNKPDSATLDHIIPLSVSRTHTAYNCQLLCHACNSTKDSEDTR